VADPELPVPPTGRPPALAERLLGGRYRLLRPLATGGMAQVWEATDEVLARRVAIKILHPHLAADASFVERFRREAVSAARLAHPSIVSIYDTCSEDDVEAIVMELVEGRTLRDLLDEKGNLPVGEAVGIVAEVADALEVAHKAGVVHRDIKPANILLSSDGRVLVADFGIAKAGGDLTATNTTMGTAKYLAPEQVEGAPVDARTDVYALGVVLYELLCGRPPFLADTEAGTALARLHQEPMRPRQVRAGIPKPIEDVVLRAMARAPADRYVTAGALRAALLAAARGEVISQPFAASPPPLDATAAVFAPPPSPPADRTPPGGVPLPAPPRRRQRGRALPVAIAVLVTAALIVAALLLYGGGKSGSLNPSASGSDAVATGGVTLQQAAAFDPPPGDGEENNSAVGAVLDDNPATTWQTEGYNDRRFGTKPGVGIIVTLSEARTLKDLRVTSPSNDWTADVYVADTPQSTLSAWGDPVDHKENVAAGTAAFNLHGKRAGAVLLWFTDLGDEPPRTHLQVAEVAVDGG
jgi:serine/threonine-protein kinase